MSRARAPLPNSVCEDVSSAQGGLLIGVPAGACWGVLSDCEDVSSEGAAPSSECEDVSSEGAAPSSLSAISARLFQSVHPGLPLPKPPARLVAGGATHGAQGPQPTAPATRNEPKLSGGEL